MSLPVRARSTRTFRFLGAQISGFVGPKSNTHCAPAAAARCGRGRFLAQRALRSFHSFVNLLSTRSSASPETTTSEEKSFHSSDSAENSASQFSMGQFFFALPLPG